MKEQGFIHIYTGNGKGKTTACIGLTIRSLGAGFRVFFCQFMKNGEYSEIKALKKIGETTFPGQLEIHQYGQKGRLFEKPTEKDKSLAVKGLQEAMAAASSGDYDLVVLDEINIVLHYNLIEEDKLLKLMEKKHKNTELVLSGRYAAEKIVQKADLVSEITPLKHYAQNGVAARVGIER